MKHLSKKHIFIFILFLLAVFIFYFVVFRRSALKQSSHLSSNPKKVKSPCREVSMAKEMESQTTSSSQRIQKLARLMDTPIDWVFEDIYGHVIDLYCLREKKILVINFWATWCPPCVEELPSLSQLAEDNKDQIFVVAISFEPIESIRDFLKHSFSDLSFSLNIAQVSLEDKLKLFPEDTLPATYIFNKKGLLRIKELRPRDWSDQTLVQQILRLP